MLKAVMNPKPQDKQTEGKRGVVGPSCRAERFPNTLPASTNYLLAHNNSDISKYPSSNTS